MTYSLGIDLGTTYTAAAVVRGGRAEVVTLGYRATSVPTVVVLTEDGTLVVGDAAERRAPPPDRLAREFKRRVGDPTPLLLGGSPVSVDRLLAEVLGFVCRTVSQTEGGAPASTVVTHPANWGRSSATCWTRPCGWRASRRRRLLPEPVAAAAWYARAERLAPGATVAVYDLGGGTFDAAVLEMGSEGAFASAGTARGRRAAGRGRHRRRGHRPRAASVGFGGGAGRPRGRRRPGWPWRACGTTAWWPRKRCRPRRASPSR